MNRWVVCAYRALSRCFPKQVHDEYGREMEQLLIDLYQSERATRGLARAAWIVLLAFLEIPIRAVVAHREQRRRMGSERDSEIQLAGGCIRRGTQRCRQECRDLFEQFRYAFRRLLRTPGFTIVAVLSLAVGIGANTAAFSVVNATLRRPWPFAEPHELVYVSTDDGIAASDSNSHVDLAALRALEHVFDDVGAFSGRLSRTRIDGRTRPVQVEEISNNLLHLLGLEPVLGRGFVPDEPEAPAHYAEAVLTWGYWHRMYGAEPSVLGRSVEIAGDSFEIVGIAPEQYTSLLAPGVEADILIPMNTLEPLPKPETRALFTVQATRGNKIIGRLQDGVDLDQTFFELNDPLMRRRAQRPLSLEPITAQTIPPEFQKALRYVATVACTALALVLLLACTNLVTMLLGRAVERRKEMAIRLALGVRRGRLVTELFFETILLAFLGGAAGLLLAFWVLEFLVAVLPSTHISIMVDYGSINVHPSLDRSVLLFTFGVASVVGVLAGLAPALQTKKRDMVESLSDDGDRSGTWHHGLQGGLVATQVAISIVLLVCGGLFLRSVDAAQRIDPGFAKRDAAMVWVDLQASGIVPNEWPVVTTEILERARSLPRVNDVAASTSIPLTIGSWSARFSIPGVEPQPGDSGHWMLFSSVDPSFFDMMGIPVVAGRAFTSLDRAGAEPVVVVNETAARRFWPGERPLDKEIVTGALGRLHRVVGVVKDTKHQTLGAEAAPTFFFSYAQLPTANVRFIARAESAPAETAVRLRRAAEAVDPNLVIITETTLDAQLAVSLLPSRLTAGLLGVFSVLALALVCLGVYGSVSSAVRCRTREVVIRISLGANARSVTGMVVRHTMIMVLLGVTVGLAGALGLSGLLDRLLVGIAPHDMNTFIAVPLILWLVALVAAYVPARRAARTDATLALRYE